MPSHKNFSLTNNQIGEIINPLSSANGINLTASSTVGGIINYTSTVYKNTTNSFSFGGVFSLPSWTTATILRSCLSGGSGYQLEVVGTTGKFKVTLNATVYESTIPGGGSLTASNLEAGSTHSILAIINVGSATTTVSFYLDGYLLNTTSAQANVDVTNANVYYTGGLVSTRYTMTVYDVYDYNRTLDSDEVLDLYNNGINYADKWGSHTATYTSDFSAGVDGFTASANATINGNQDGVSDGVTSKDNCLMITSTGTSSVYAYKTNLDTNKYYRYEADVYIPITNTTVDGVALPGNNNHVTIGNLWTTVTGVFTGSPNIVFTQLVGNSGSGVTVGDKIYISEARVYRAGATLALEPLNIQPSPGQWLDSSSNKLHAVQPLTGSSLTQPKRDFEIRGITSWTASHTAQDIVGVAQNVLPPNAYIQSIVGVITGADVEDIIIGDGSDGDRWVTITTGLATGTVSFTIANHISDGSHEQLVVDPDADCTMSIEWTIKGVIL